MRNRYTSQSNVPNWLKWSLGIFCFILIVGSIYGIFLYKSIQKNKVAGFAETEEKVLSETELTVIDDIYRFHGEEAFHILFGKSKDGKKKIVFLPLEDKGKDKKMTIIDESKIIQKQTILNQWHSQCEKCDFKKIQPAMIDDKPLWEVTYIDKAGRYTFDYLSIYDGSRYEQLRFKQMYD